MENDNLVPEAAAVTAPKEVRSKKWLFISILILIIGGALVYFVSGGNEFEGRITEDLTPLELANSEMEKISPYASVVEEGDLKWPLIVGKTTAFSLTDKRDISLFTPGDSIDVKWLKANFEAEVSAGRVTVSDTTEAFGIENHQVCVTFDQDEETCYSKEEISIGAKFSKEYQTGGSHLIKSTVSDQSGHSDSFEQEIEVSILTEGSPVEEEGDEGGGMPVSPVEDEPVEEEGDEGGGMPVSPVEDEPVVESDDGGGMAQMALEPAQAPDMSCTATRIGQTYEVNFVLTNNEALFPITDFEWIWDFKGGSSPRSGGLEENHTYTGPGDYPVTATGTGGAEEVVEIGRAHV